MKITDLITLERIACDAEVSSKKRLLELLSDLISEGEPNLTTTEVLDSLVERERLGSTGLGQGVAIPHGRLKDRNRVVGAFVKLTAGVDFDSGDNLPVDLVFALLVPEHFTDEHLQILAYLAEMFSDRALCARLRECHSNVSLFELLRGWEPHQERV
jgi:Phosphotransferase system mannitol/fructose-specific IIA domain (Ntr-type)